MNGIISVQIMLYHEFFRIYLVFQYIFMYKAELSKLFKFCTK